MMAVTLEQLCREALCSVEGQQEGAPEVLQGAWTTELTTSPPWGGGLLPRAPP